MAFSAITAGSPATVSAAPPRLKFIMPASVSKSVASTWASPSNVTLLALVSSGSPASVSRLLTESVTM